MWAGEGPSRGSHPGDRETHAPRPLPGPGTQLVPSKCVRMESRRNLLIRWRPAVRLTETPTPCRSLRLQEKAAGQSQRVAAGSRPPVSGHTGGSGRCARCGPRPPTADGGGHPELGEDISGTEWKSQAGKRKPAVMGSGRRPGLCPTRRIHPAAEPSPELSDLGDRATAVPWGRVSSPRRPVRFWPLSAGRCPRGWHRTGGWKSV